MALRLVTPMPTATADFTGSSQLSVAGCVRLRVDKIEDLLFLSSTR